MSFYGGVGISSAKTVSDISYESTKVIYVMKGTEVAVAVAVAVAAGDGGER